MDNTEAFIQAVRDNLEPHAVDLADALYLAMDAVLSFPNDREVRYFGAIGYGTFYAGGSIDEVRWYPRTIPADAIQRLSDEFGVEFVRGLEAY